MLEPTPHGYAILKQVRDFIREEVAPVEAVVLAERRAAANPWVVDPRVEALKAKARAAGLWNLFLPGAHGAGLTTYDYAFIAEASGHSFLAPEVFNCNAPDTGNMEVLEKYGTPEQQAQWLKPLMAGSIRSAFCMTEPEVASSDATNMAARIDTDGDLLVLNGRKWWSTGIGHPHCRVVIFMGVSNPEAPRHRQHAMVLVPTDTPGVKIERMLPVFGELDPPYGHGEVSFTDVRVPVANYIGGPGRGFEIAQGRLGPGRIHHCMRMLGGAERALTLMCERALSRRAFGRPLAELGGNLERIAEARVAIEQARLLTLKAAWLIDQGGAKAAALEIAAIKVIAPRVGQMVVDEAIQLFGAGGLSHDWPLADLYIQARCLRIADGPDAVHLTQIGKAELRKYAPAEAKHGH